MLVALHQLTAALYLAAGIGAAGGLALSHPRAVRVSVGLLAVGCLVHGLSFTSLHAHGGEGAPALTNTASAVSFMAWMGTLGYLLIALRARVSGLLVLVAPMAFLGVFTASLALPGAAPATGAESGSVPHAHVLLASAGLALLGLAGLAGVLYLGEHYRLKHKQRLPEGLALPSLESLDRVNALALAVGFPLLTLGVVTGALWVRNETGGLWSGSVHESWSLVAWAIYAVLVTLRFGAHLPARRCAVTAVAGFAFLAFAVLGVELLA